MTTIKQRREALGLSQADLAAKLDVVRSTIAMWETGHNVPPTRLLPALAQALECSIDYLLNSQEEEVQPHDD